MSRPTLKCPACGSLTPLDYDHAREGWYVRRRADAFSLRDGVYVCRACQVKPRRKRVTRGRQVGARR